MRVFRLSAVFLLLLAAIVVFSIKCSSSNNAGNDDRPTYSYANDPSTMVEAKGKADGKQIIDVDIPSPLKNVPEQILVRKGYVVSYNKETRLPNWVAWRLTAEHVDGPAKRPNNAWHEDTDVPLRRATSSDYKGSGWTRGHMCPAGDNKWDRDAMYDTFSYVNICPQNANLNNGLWNSIEMDCRRWAKQYGDIYIVCGPIFYRQEHEKIGTNKVYVPEAFFKVVLCMNGKPKAFGFVVKNTDGNKKRDLYYNSIDGVERITGHDFFSMLPDSIETMVEAKADKEEWG